MDNSHSEPLYRISEVSKMLNVPIRVLYYWIEKSDEIKPVPIGTGRQSKLRKKDVEIMRLMAVKVQDGISINDMAKKTGLPISTILFWEKRFPMFCPNRTPKGTRRYTPYDMRIAEEIKDLLYNKGLRVNAAVAEMERRYGTERPECKTIKEAIARLEGVAYELQGTQAALKILPVVQFLNTLRDDRGSEG